MDVSKNKPLVSVIIPTYNRKKKLPTAIDSVLNQTYKNWELIVVDDRSTDDTRKLIEKYSQRNKRIKYLLNKRKKGPAGARNHGMKNAKGKYIAFLDSDDEWYPNHIKDSVELMEKAGLDMVFGKDNLIDKGVNKKKYITMSLTKKRFYDNLPKKNIFKEGYILEGFFNYLIGNSCLATDSIMVRKEVLERLRGFDEKLRVAEDYDLWLRIAKDFKIGYLDKLKVKYNLSQGHYSMDIFDLEKNLQLCNSNIHLYKKLLKEKLTRKQKAAIRSQISKNYLGLGYSYYLNNRLKKAKQNYIKSLKNRMNLKAVKGMIKASIVPKILLRRYNKRSR